MIFIGFDAKSENASRTIKNHMFFIALPQNHVIPSGPNVKNIPPRVETIPS